jgi:hypothetical protein
VAWQTTKRPALSGVRKRRLDPGTTEETLEISPKIAKNEVYGIFGLTEGNSLF